MTPNPVEQFTIENENRNKFPNSSNVVDKDSGSYYLNIFQSSLSLLAHILIGTVIGICLVFSFMNGLPLGATRLHIVLCVIGVSIFFNSDYIETFLL